MTKLRKSAHVVHASANEKAVRIWNKFVFIAALGLLGLAVSSDALAHRGRVGVYIDLWPRLAPPPTRHIPITRRWSRRQCHKLISNRTRNKLNLPKRPAIGITVPSGVNITPM